MANIKISELEELISVNDNDVLPIVDTINNETKKINSANLQKKSLDEIANLKNNVYTKDESDSKIKEVTDSVEEINTNVGNLESLNTPSKSNLVAAINETYENNVYSTKEQKIGTWIDGRPLYRRVFTGTTSSDSVTPVSTELISGNIEMINSGGYLTQVDNEKLHMSIGGYINANWYCGVYLEETRLVIMAATNLHSAKYVLWVEYVKTTD